LKAAQGSNRAAELEAEPPGPRAARRAGRAVQLGL